MPDPEATAGNFSPIFLVAISMNPSVPHFSTIPSVALIAISSKNACPLALRIKTSRNKSDAYTFFIFDSLLNNYYS